MDSKNIDIVQQDFTYISNEYSRFVRVFCTNLYELEPAISQLFQDSIRQERRKLQKKINYIFLNLENPAHIAPKLYDLGVYYRNKGVQQDYFKSIEKAFLSTISSALGDKYDRSRKLAWEEVISILSHIIIRDVYNK